MGCFTVLKSKRKKNERINSLQRTYPQAQEPTALPEPKNKSGALQSAPPSFRTRGKPAQPDIKVLTNRMRALSAPESLDTAEQDALASNEDDLKNRITSAKEQWPCTPLPLPLPSPDYVAALKPTSSFKSGSGSGPLCFSGPLPLPPNGNVYSSLKNFSFDEIATACLNFASDRCVSEGLSSIIYRASFLDDNSISKKFEASIIRLHAPTQSMRDFLNEINVIGSLRHPNLCKLIGYHASEHRILVYERLHHGSLDRILYNRSDGPSIDWNTRMKIALCAAQGLTFLHEEGPFQAMYNEFSTTNIQIDIDFSAKLSGYGCVGHTPETDIPSNSIALGNLSVETVEKGLLTPKSNVWSFGVVLLELLTGRKNLDPRHPKEERNILKWSRPYLADEWRLSLIMDPQLKGRFSAKAARAVAEVALRCIQADPSERPTMRAVLENLKLIQDIKYSCRFPLQEPTVAVSRHMLRSPSLNGITAPPLRLNVAPSIAAPSIVSPTRPPAFPITLPPRTCSTLSLEEFERLEIGKRLSTDVCCSKG